MAVLAALALSYTPVSAQETALLWPETQYYRYNIEGISVDTTTVPRTVKVIFSVTNPQAGNAAYDIKTAITFKPPATLRMQVGWDTTEYTNLGAAAKGPSYALWPVYRKWEEPLLLFPPGQPGAGATAPASAMQVEALAASKACTATDCPGVTLAGRFWVKANLPPQAAGTGTVGMEGHPSRQTGIDASGAAIFGTIPVKSVVRNFMISSASIVPRRKIVDFAKCQGCHDNRKHGDFVVPRLSLHGGNRNEEPGLCVICHNPNQTDAPYRVSGAEESVDFKRMVHGIHAGGLRENKLVIVGFRGVVHDYSHVRFPAELKECARCHIDNGSQGTFELRTLPVLGSTINTASLITIPGQVDIDPSNNLRISPIAATCSGCHDKAEVRSHMIRNGASFGVLQSDLQGKERCVNCHGPGKERDVRKAHLGDDD